MAGKGGGAWKVAYADFVTAMMAFFMVMWLVGQSEEKKKAVSDYFSDPWAKSRFSLNRSREKSINGTHLGKSKPDEKRKGGDPKLVPHDDPHSEDRKRPKLVTVRAPERTTVGTVIFFELGETELHDEGRKKLKDLMPGIDGLQNKIDVRGHVSPQSGTKTSANQLWALSWERCMTVRNHMIELGIKEDRIRLSVAGPFEPLVVDNNSPESSENARVEVFLLSETVGKYQLNTAETPIGLNGTEEKEPKPAKEAKPKEAAPKKKSAH
jgi:chemotaxis protein MotB